MSKPETSKPENVKTHLALNEAYPPADAPKKAMILAAGLGTRMRPITDTIAKPMVEIEGRSLILRIIDHLAEMGVDEVVINLHHKADKLRAHLKDVKTPNIVFSDETDELLETGGGIAKALPLLGDKPFYVINGDVMWFDGGSPALSRLANAWDAYHDQGLTVDALLMVHSTPRAHGYQGKGDFFMDPLGVLRRRAEKEVGPYVFAGVQILNPKLFTDIPKDGFSMNLLYDRCLNTEEPEKSTLRGLAHDGSWYHVGTPPDIDMVERLIKDDSIYPDVAHR